jgi:hypothetical protein
MRLDGLKGEHMKPALNKFTLALGIILMGALLTGQAFAACAGQVKSKPGATWVPQSWDGQLGSLIPISDRSSDDSIVGMWHVTFTAEGNDNNPPDKTPIDNAIVIWHADKTEMMVSARPPQDGDVCTGVWEKTGRSTYQLNHIAWLANDTTNAPTGIGNPQGPTRIFQWVTLSPDGDHYSGRFTLDGTDTSGNPTAHIIGVITATRITLGTTVKDLL